MKFILKDTLVCLQYNIRQCNTFHDKNINIGHVYFLDVNECFTNPCDVNAECQNFRGNFSCRCKVGYFGNGLNCTGEPYKISSTYVAREKFVFS